MCQAFVNVLMGAVLAGYTMAGIIHGHFPDHQQQINGVDGPTFAHNIGVASSTGASNHKHYDHSTIESPKHEHKHQIKHEQHATSHQMFKIHHFHAVPVYVKKEHQHLLKHPVEIGGINHKLKQVHPVSQKNYGHGQVLENHTEQKSKGPHHHHHNHEPAEATVLVGVKLAAEQHALFDGFGQPEEAVAGGGAHQFHGINVRRTGGQYK